jgi:hypothetical protein
VSELIIFLETSFVFSVLVLSVPLYQPVLGFVLRLLRVLGGQRLRARGEEVFHCEFARVSTGVGVWIGAELALSQSQKARRIMVTVIRSCGATREARSGTRRMTVPLPF